jgi:acyl-CoA thioester hydrolase
MFFYEHRVQFYETDLMGIVHHSNYLRLYEEARVAWAHDRKMIDYQRPESASFFAVVGTEVNHLRPAKFGDVVRVHLQACLQGARMLFEYKMFCGEDLVSTARTTHACLDKNLKAIRPPKELRSILEKESWIETWL